MPFASLPPIGAIYNPRWNNIAWNQPNGVGTSVFPAQRIGVPFNEYPVPGEIWGENSGLWTAGCGHWFDSFLIQRDYDNMFGSSAALILCPVCTFIVNIVEPYEAVYDVMKYPIIVG